MEIPAVVEVEDEERRKDLDTHIRSGLYVITSELETQVVHVSPQRPIKLWLSVRPVLCDLFLESARVHDIVPVGF